MQKAGKPTLSDAFLGLIEKMRRPQADAARLRNGLRHEKPCASRACWLRALRDLGRRGRATAKDTGLIFVSNEKSNTVTVLDGKSYAPVATIRTGKRPRDIKLNAERTRLYVACGDDNRIDVIDVAKLAVVDQIRGIAEPEVFDIGPGDRQLFVSNEDDGKLSIVDLATKKVVKSIKVGQEPEGVLVSPDGATVYVASEAASLVHVIDVASGAIKADIPVGSRPRRFAQPSDGKEIWVSAEVEGTVYVIDAPTNKVIKRIEFQPRGFRRDDIRPVGLKLTRDGATAYVTLGAANRVAVVDGKTKEVRDYILVGSRPWDIALQPRREPAVRRQRRERRYHHHRRQGRQGDPLGAGRTFAAQRGDR